MPRGVKFEITPKLLEEIEDMASCGMFEKDIALCLGITAKCLTENKSLKSELSEAIKRGNAKGLRRTTNKLRECVEDREIAAIIYYLKCKGQWREPEKEDNSSEALRKEMSELKEELKQCRKIS